MRKLKIPENLTTLAYRHIRDYILEGRLDEGARLTEEFLASTLGISKSPIREALTRLESEGLIRIEPRRGASLVQFTIDEVAELYDVREVLEAHAVASLRITPEFLDQLDASVEAMREQFTRGDKARYIEEDAAFHRIIAEASGNGRLARMLENLQHQVWLCRRKTYDLSRSRAVESHAAIAAALREGRKRAAERLMREHIAGVRKTLLDHLRGLETSAQSA